MTWLSMLTPPSETRLRELAQQVASCSQAAVQKRVREELPGLQLTEARGYVRARGSAIIKREVAQLVSRQPQLRNFHQQLQHLASEAAIRQVIWQMLQDRKQHQLAEAAQRRAA